MPSLIIEGEDILAREWLQKLETKIHDINERTKRHTLDIRELRNKLKEISELGIKGEFVVEERNKKEIKNEN